MILSFEFSNYRSIQDTQEISFVASPLKDEGVDLIQSDAFPKNKILPAIVVYGANASGKSNVVKALSSMLRAVRLSHREGDPDGGIPRSPFLLDEACAEAPTVFELNFIFDGNRYNYGFEFDDNEYSAEWLFSYSGETGRRRRLFERENGVYSFGRELKGRNQVIKDLARKNSLFLSAAIQNGHEQLTEIGSFLSSISFEMSLSLGSLQAEMRLASEHDWNIDDGVIEFLEKIGTGISGYKVKNKELPSEVLTMEGKINRALDTALKSLGPEFKFIKEETDRKEIELEHRGVEGKGHYFPINLESAGTLRLISAMPKLFKALALGGVVVFDELDLSLHTKAAEAIVALFANEETNPKGAQLLATTHDTNLLKTRYLRRDQVWFTEKNEFGATSVYPLTDISTRQSDDIERGYLQGRFGAIPF